MKHLIVAAHPSEASFTMSVTRAYADEIEKLGHELHMCDLYRMGFNPVSDARELAGPGAGRAPEADVVREQNSCPRRQRSGIHLSPVVGIHAGDHEGIHRSRIFIRICL